MTATGIKAAAASVMFFDGRIVRKQAQQASFLCRTTSSRCCFPAPPFWRLLPQHGQAVVIAYTETSLFLRMTQSHATGHTF
jgi:hypothetical protein